MKLNAEQAAHVARFNSFYAGPRPPTGETYTAEEVADMVALARGRAAEEADGPLSPAGAARAASARGLGRRTQHEGDFRGAALPTAPRTSPIVRDVALRYGPQFTTEEIREFQGFAAYAQSGVPQASMSEDDDTGGGYLVVPGSRLDNEIGRIELDATPMRQVARVIPVDTEEYAKLMSMGDGEGGWVGEREARPGTATPNLKKVAPYFGEIYAFPYITQKLLDDTDQVGLVNWLAEEVGSIFAQKENIAFINGNGVGQPRGLLTYPIVAVNPAFGELKQVKSGVNGATTSDKLLEVVYTLKAAYRRKAVWMMSSTMQLQIRQLKDGQNNYIWKAGAEAGQPATLMGYPVVENDQMPNPATGSNSIAFADFARGYKIADNRLGIRVKRDDLTAKPYVGFYSTKRLGGGVEDSNAIIIHTLAV